MADRKIRKVYPPLNLGDRVRIKHYDPSIGKIVELRGALGPGGASVYRVRINRKPTPIEIEVLDSQIDVVPEAELEQLRLRRKARLAKAREDV